MTWIVCKMGRFFKSRYYGSLRLLADLHGNTVSRSAHRQLIITHDGSENNSSILASLMKGSQTAIVQPYWTLTQSQEPGHEPSDFLNAAVSAARKTGNERESDRHSRTNKEAKVEVGERPRPDC